MVSLVWKLRKAQSFNSLKRKCSKSKLSQAALKNYSNVVCNVGNICLSSLYVTVLTITRHFVSSSNLRRKLKADITAAFPSLSADELSNLIPNKEDLNVVKIYAHKGDAVTLYLMNKNPLFFELEKQLYPTGKTPAAWWRETLWVLWTNLFQLCLFSVVLSFSVRALALPGSPSKT